MNFFFISAIFRLKILQEQGSETRLFLILMDKGILFFAFGVHFFAGATYNRGNSPDKAKKIEK